MYGCIHAVGLQVNMITFTSNRLAPKPRDWQGIKISGDGRKSVIAYSIIKYADYGIAINNRDEKDLITIENCQIQWNNIGILISGWGFGETDIIHIRNNQIRQNVYRGIYIGSSGGDRIRGIRIAENEIVENGIEGICLWDRLSVPLQSVEITGNTIYDNSISGIRIDGMRFESSKVKSNYIHDNECGINVTCSDYFYFTLNFIYDNQQGINVDACSYFNITLNSVYHNTEYGMFIRDCRYRGSINYNDIFENGIGMDVRAYSEINADHNYWGDPNGPYHESLNPTGTGNPVGVSDSSDLHFIPWEEDFVVPEFPSPLILPLFMITALLAVIVYKPKHSIASKW